MKKKKTNFILLFLWISLLISGLLLGINGCRSLYNKYRASDWKTTLGQITELKTEKSPRGTFLEYTPVVKYCYFISSNQYFGSSVLPGEMDLKTVEKKFSKGKQINVFFNPKKPSDSLLFRNINPRDISLLVYGVFILICLYPFGILIKKDQQKPNNNGN
ncbi:DUF3592 domain-containing protein [bacterium]|nr:DUF3592 domain-containing protein [bacterium]